MGTPLGGDFLDGSAFVNAIVDVIFNRTKKGN